MRTGIFALAAAIIFALAQVAAADRSSARPLGAALGLGTNYETVYEAQ